MRSSACCAISVGSSTVLRAPPFKIALNVLSATSDPSLPTGIPNTLDRSFPPKTNAPDAVSSADCPAAAVAALPRSSAPVSSRARCRLLPRFGRYDEANIPSAPPTTGPTGPVTGEVNAPSFAPAAAPANEVATEGAIAAMPRGMSVIAVPAADSSPSRSYTCLVRSREGASP